MNRDLKIYFIGLCLPALLITGAAFYSLFQEFSEANIADKTVQVMNLAESLQDDKSYGESDVLSRVLNEIKEFKGIKGTSFASPGAFIWQPMNSSKRSAKQSKKPGETNRGETVKLLEHQGLDPETIKEIEKKTHWNDWTSDGAKRPRRGIIKTGSFQILWARVNHSVYSNVVAGLVLNETFLKEKSEAINRKMNDVKGSMEGISTYVFVIAGALAFLLLALFSAGFFVVHHSAQRARIEREKAERENMMKTSFLSNCSHEMNTPLAGIKVWADQLLEGRLKTDGQRANAYRHIVEENDRMIRIVKSILEYTRLAQSRKRYVFGETDVSVLTGDVVSFMRNKFIAHGIELRDGGEWRIRTDSDAVKQILVNLIENASKYAAEYGLVEVEVSHDERFCRISVADRGPGVRPEDKTRIFEYFYRADDALNSKTGGLGLGLSISLELANDIGGNLSVADREGGGCVFTLELPNISQIG